MRKLQIGIDMDGVLCNLLVKWLEKYNADFHDDLKPEDITLWNWHPLTKDKKGEKIYTFLDDPELFLNLPVIEGSQEVLRKYHKDIDFWIVTACFNPENMLPKWKWLRMHFPFLDSKKFMFVRDKGGFAGDLLVDDKPENIDRLNGRGILFTAPHNKHRGGYMRADNWYELDKIFDRLLYWRRFEDIKVSQLAYVH